MIYSGRTIKVHVLKLTSSAGSQGQAAFTLIDQQRFFRAATKRLTNLDVQRQDIHPGSIGDLVGMAIGRLSGSDVPRSGIRTQMDAHFD